MFTSANNAAVLGTCDVCQLLDGDASRKPVHYCSMCDAWLCVPCTHNWARRVQAFLKRRIG